MPDNTHSFDIKTCWKNAIVIQAETREFSASETYTYPCVQSRYLVWCRSGRGVLEINGTAYHLTAGTVLFTPWNHSITYIPDKNHPFSLGTIHLIPCLKDPPSYYRAIHDLEPGNPIWQNRQDEFLPGFENTVCRQLTADSMLLKLADYIASKFFKMAAEDELRLQARMLMYELYYMLHSEDDCRMPAIVTKIIDRMNESLEFPVDIKEFAGLFKISQSSLYRYFNRWVGVPPNEYMQEKRLCRAAALLRSSTIRISELSDNLQFSSPQYFIRCFKKRFGVPPGQYAKGNFSADFPASHTREPFSSKNISVKTRFPMKYIADKPSQDDPAE